MKLYVMDTDIVGLAFQRHSKVLQRIQSLPEDDLIVTTIITFGEDLSGWLLACRRAPDGAARARAYARLQRGLDFYTRWPCLPFDPAAAVIFDDLRGQKLRIGTNDLAIAAITLSTGGVLLARNAVDFERIPNLVFEDEASIRSSKSLSLLIGQKGLSRSTQSPAWRSRTVAAK